MTIRVRLVTTGRDDGFIAKTWRNLAPAQGPTQSNGMCLLELVVHWNLKPNESTEQTVDLPQVTSCGPGPVSLPGAFISWGYLPGLLVGPVSALAQALTLPAISVPQCAWSGAISKLIRA